ncbi:MAG: polysaccharide biosynthesis/export family protein [Candidatus Omnitrophota bacterium]|jgi:polysaccharide export outer membrane protein
MKQLFLGIFCLLTALTYVYAAETVVNEYAVGVDDILDISVLQPEKLITTASVSPDGSITFPYIGNVQVKGLTLTRIQETIQAKLGDGYMKYPVVAVSLRESRSRKFFVYGEVMKPGTYVLDENATVLRAISMAGGFNKFGSSSRVKVLRPKDKGTGYSSTKVNIKAVMDGDANADIVLKPGDIVVVSEGVF